jgi:anti-sigma B factor antagonist
MKVTSRQVNDVTIVYVSGAIKLDGKGSSVLRDTIKELLLEGKRRILLNLHEVNYIDTEGVGGLASVLTSVHNHGGELKLLTLTKNVRAVLKIMKLDTVFHVMEDEAGAIASFDS